MSNLTPKLPDSESCCGCSACFAICPTQAIKMEEDYEGFKQPLIDLSVCIKCGQCESVCPVLHPNESREPLAVYTAKALDNNIRMKSSSGGLFTIIAEEIRPFVQKDDIVIITPEYAQYEHDGFWGNKEVLGVVFDVMPELRPRISVKQWRHLLKYVPNYAAKKAMNAVIHLFHRKTSVPDIRQEYNLFGDHIGHWDQAPLRVPPVAQVKNVKLSKTCFDSLESFVREIREKGARVGLMPPCFQASSYDHSLPLIERVEQELRKRELPLLAPMRRYRMDDDLCYDTPYHLVKEGVDVRTQLFVEDLAALLGESNQVRALK